ncbi:autotransporter adhesin [Actinobacillus seminis]|nr:autotransporter adhesin [Actinobacillus seminis]
MNNIFKVIWSKATRQPVVVSELSKSNGKVTSQTDKHTNTCDNIQGRGNF